jgi:hypothetical protein
MSRYTLIGLLLLLGGTAAGGYYLGRGQREVIVKEGKTITVERVRTVVVTKTVHPDGTTTETTSTTDKETEKEKTKKDSTSTPMLSDYSVGVKYWMGQGRSPTNYYGNVEVTAGRRLVGDVWLEAGVIPLQLQGSIGFSVRF